MERGEEKEEKRNITKRYRVMIYHAYDMRRIFGEDIQDRGVNTNNNVN